MKLKQTTPTFWVALIAYFCLELFLVNKWGLVAMFIGAFTACCGVFLLKGIKTLRVSSQEGKNE